MKQPMNEMSDLGETYPSHPCGCEDCAKREAGKEEQKKHYPRESFTTEQMPTLKGLNVGDKVKIVIECEVCSVSQGDEYGMTPDGQDEEEIKTRVSIKMLSGMASKSQDTSGTMAEQSKAKEKKFNDGLGLNDEPSGDETGDQPSGE